MQMTKNMYLNIENISTELGLNPLQNEKDHCH